MSKTKNGSAGKAAVVVVLRRDQNELTTEERTALLAKFKGRAVRYHRTDPRDYKEHASLCREIQPDAVILPLEKPIPSLAMEEGFSHIAFVNGDYKKLKPLKPQFEEFVPG